MNWFVLSIAGALLVTAIAVYFLLLRIRRIERYQRGY